jgi:histidinol-phosphatase (PHP family)
MPWTNYHTHCRYCDGTGEPREYAEQAVQKGLRALGFSSHAPLPFTTDWTMRPELLDEYCEQIKSLKQEYREKIPLYLGLEIDYIRGVIGPHSDHIKSLGLDYTIGAVHFYGMDLNGQWPAVDGSAEEFSLGLNGIFEGDIQRAVESHFSLIREMVLTQPPDILAHLDLIKKNNPGERYFSESDVWYQKTVNDTLDAVAESGVILEVNTGGLIRKRTSALYPSLWILDRCRDLKIPLVMNADAHNPKNITGHFSEAAALLRDKGFRELNVLTNTGWESRPFSSSGILL